MEFDYIEDINVEDNMLAEEFMREIFGDDIDYWIAHHSAPEDNRKCIGVEWGAYGNWYKYADGHEEYVSMGD